jgi:hypothetical protein
MAIETRNGQPYYYRKRRIGRHVVSEYVGCGLIAEIEAEEDAQAQAERQARRAAWRAERERQAELDSQVDRACASIRAAVAAALEAAGFHRHKGQWRKRHARDHA